MELDKQRWLNAVVTSHVGLVQQLEDDIVGFIERCSRRCADAFLGRHRLFIAGNGGSAADAQHLAAEFVGRFSMDRPSLPALALTTDTSILTALANDYGYAKVFSRQLEGLSEEGDLLLLISTSGNSANLIAAAEVARGHNMAVLALSGRDGGRLREVADDILVVPSQHTARIQEVHLLVEHLLCEAVERHLFTGGA